MVLDKHHYTSRPRCHSGSGKDRSCCLQCSWNLRMRIAHHFLSGGLLVEFGPSTVTGRLVAVAVHHPVLILRWHPCHLLFKVLHTAVLLVVNLNVLLAWNVVFWSLESVCVLILLLVVLVRGLRWLEVHCVIVSRIGCITDGRSHLVKSFIHLCMSVKFAHSFDINIWFVHHSFSAQTSVVHRSQIRCAVGLHSFIVPLIEFNCLSWQGSDGEFSWVVFISMHIWGLLVVDFLLLPQKFFVFKFLLRLNCDWSCYVGWVRLSLCCLILSRAVQTSASSISHIDALIFKLFSFEKWVQIVAVELLVLVGSIMVSSFLAWLLCCVGSSHLHCLWRRGRK